MDLTEAEIGEEEHQQEGYREREECNGSSEKGVEFLFPTIKRGRRNPLICGRPLGRGLDLVVMDPPLEWKQKEGVIP